MITPLIEPSYVERLINFTLKRYTSNITIQQEDESAHNTKRILK